VNLPKFVNRCKQERTWDFSFTSCRRTASQPGSTHRAQVTPPAIAPAIPARNLLRDHLFLASDIVLRLRHWLPARNQLTTKLAARSGNAAVADDGGIARRLKRPPWPWPSLARRNHPLQ
jgi:hypothetical protein